MKIPRSYRKPLTIAIVLHVVIAIVLIIKLPNWSYRYDSAKGSAKIVHATAVTSKQVQKAMHDIQYRQQAKERAQRARLARLKAQTVAEKRRQATAKRHIEQIKRQQVVLEQARKKQLLALAQVKHQATKARQAAAREKTERAKAVKLLATQKKKALLAKQQKIQQQMLAQQLAGDSNQLKKVQTLQMHGIMNKYIALILSAIQPNWLVPGGISKKLSCIYEIQLAPGGMVLSAKLIKSSGNSALDQSAKTAIFKSSPLPVPKNPAAFNNFRDIHLTLSPKNIVNS